MCKALENTTTAENEVRKAVLLSDAEYIFPHHLSINSGESRQEEKTLTMMLDEGASLDDILRTVQRNLIEKALEQAGGNKVKAAKILQINRKQLYRKMESLHM